MEEKELKIKLENLSKEEIIENLIGFYFYMDSFSNVEKVKEWFEKSLNK